MRRLPAAIAAAAITAIALAGCASSSSIATAAAPPAPLSAYTRAINAMTAHCKGSAAQIANMVAETHKLEVQEGVKDESMTALARHLETAVSAYGPQKTNCSGPFAAYLTLREG